MTFVIGCVTVGLLTVGLQWYDSKLKADRWRNLSASGRRRYVRQYPIDPLIGAEQATAAFRRERSELMVPEWTR